VALATALGAAIFSSIRVDYKLFTNIAGFLIFAGLFWLTLGRGANDPVCGMPVDRRKALHIDFGGERFYFCSHHCVHAFEVNPA